LTCQLERVGRELQILECLTATLPGQSWWPWGQGRAWRWPRWLAVVTGSAAMAAEAAHSLGDTANDLFLLVAQRRSSRLPDKRHPLGYGREAYFWALIAALGVFIAAAAFSLRQGITDLIHPGVTSAFLVAYIVLGASTVFDALSFRQSAHQMSETARLADRSILDEATTTSDSNLRAVFSEDVISVAGDVLALAGLGLSQLTGSSTPQAAAAVLIALVLIRISLGLVSRNHDFLVGQTIPPADRDRVRAFLLAYPGVTDVVELLVTYVGPGQVWVVARVTVNGTLGAGQVTQLVRSIEADLGEQSHFIYRVDVVPYGEDHSARRQE
jgi:cation diffusion facilitator family transporter